MRSASGGPCCHCGRTISPCWRKGPPEKPCLCNACGARWLVSVSRWRKHPCAQPGGGADGRRALHPQVKHNLDNYLPADMKYQALSRPDKAFLGAKPRSKPQPKSLGGVLKRKPKAKQGCVAALGLTDGFVLTSETIYSPASQLRLLDCIKRVLQPPHGGVAYVAAKTTYGTVTTGTTSASAAARTRSRRPSSATACLR